ncbi:MAG: hypothetical protein ACOY3Y_04895 [Acidobacteriota bacterium]
MDNCGIDVHRKSSEVCVVDEVGEIVERAQIPTIERSLVRWFGDRVSMRICIDVRRPASCGSMAHGPRLSALHDHRCAAPA